MAETNEPRGGREGILDAIVDVIADEGIAKASVRTVAQRAGVSIGAVQYHFRTTAQMLEGAMARLTVQFQEQATGLFAASAGAGDGDETSGSDETGASAVDRVDRREPSPQEARTALEAMCASLALVDEADRRLGGVWLDFVAASRVHEGLRRIHRDAWAALREAFAYLIVRHTPDHLEPQRAADMLLAVLDGLAVSRMTEPEHMTGERARAVCEATLAAVLDPGLGGVWPAGRRA